jgi:outer membrane protein
MNKSLILVFAFIVVTNVVDAQTTSGNMMVGGSVDYTSYTRQGGSPSDYNEFTFSPSFGYFISDNFAAGASLSIGTRRTGTGSAKTTESSFGIGPFARYYKFTSNDRFAFFGEAGLSFASGKTDPPLGNVTKNSSIGFYLSPGAAFFFNEHWALELSIAGFQVTSVDPDTSSDNDKYTWVNFDIRSFSPNLGVRYHF